MTLLTKYLILATMLYFSFNACGKKNDTCLKAKVVRVSCASFVVQVLNRDSVGDYGWRDIGGHTVYNNVFNVKNSCSIGKWARGEEFYFNIKDSSGNSDCIKCMMYDSPPGKSYEVENVSRRCK